MKVRCGDCGKLIELQDVMPSLDQNGAFWLRFWCVIGPIIGLILLTLIGWGIFSTYSEKREAEMMLREQSIKVKVTEFPSGQQMREFSR